MGELMAYNIVTLTHHLSKYGAMRRKDKIADLGFISNVKETEWGGVKLYIIYLPNAISTHDGIVQYNTKTNETNSISWKELMTV